MRTSMVTILESVVDAALGLWFALVAAQHLAAIVFVLWGSQDAQRTDLRVVSMAVGVLLLIGFAVIRVLRLREVSSDR